MTLLGRVTPVRSIKVAKTNQVPHKINVDTSVAVKVIDLKMLKNEINRILL